MQSKPDGGFKRDELSYLRFLSCQVIQTEHFGQLLLRESLFGPYNCGALRTFFSLWWIEENKLLNLPQLI